jgi:large subunit ribosomal protein L17
MRHRKSGRKFGRSSSHRKAMYRNMVLALIQHGRIKTTLAKAKEVRKYIEKAITWGTSLGELLTINTDEIKDKDERKAAEAKIVHHYRMASRLIPDFKKRDMTSGKLFHGNKKDKPVGGFGNVKKQDFSTGEIPAYLNNRKILTRLFKEIAPLFLNEKNEYQGGYTRIIKGSNRRGDNAPMVLLELTKFIEKDVEETEED